MSVDRCHAFILRSVRPSVRPCISYPKLFIAVHLNSTLMRCRIVPAVRFQTPRWCVTGSWNERLVNISSVFTGFLTQLSPLQSLQRSVYGQGYEASQVLIQGSRNSGRNGPEIPGGMAQKFRAADRPPRLNFISRRVIPIVQPTRCTCFSNYLFL